jgi:myo-inositol-1(or 4)-monophosphatase
MLDAIENAAVRACRDGGAYLRERFRADDADAEYGRHDVKTDVDRGSERRMLSVIQGSFPDHAVYAEESGEHPGEGDYRWIVDPLDGTNNFAVGLPSFASAATVLDGDGPVVAAVYLPMLDDLYVARRGDGVRYNGEPVVAESDRSLDRATVGFVVGHGVTRDEDRLAVVDAAVRRLDADCKRVVRTWAPCVDWGLLARGRFDGVVSLYPQKEEQYAGELLAAEAGVASRSGDRGYVGAANPDLLADLAAAAGVS